MSCHLVLPAGAISRFGGWLILIVDRWYCLQNTMGYTLLGMEEERSCPLVMMMIKRERRSEQVNGTGTISSSRKQPKHCK